MRFVYVITRIVDESKPGVREIPNLGIHTSLWRANKHWDSLFADRRKRSIEKNPKLKHSDWWSSYDDSTPELGRCVVRVCRYFGELKEEIRMEKWRVK